MQSVQSAEVMQTDLEATPSFRLVARKELCMLDIQEVAGLD